MVCIGSYGVTIHTILCSDLCNYKTLNEAILTELDSIRSSGSFAMLQLLYTLVFEVRWLLFY